MTRFTWFWFRLYYWLRGYLLLSLYIGVGRGRIFLGLKCLLTLITESVSTSATLGLVTTPAVGNDIILMI